MKVEEQVAYMAGLTKNCSDYPHQFGYNTATTEHKPCRGTGKAPVFTGLRERCEKLRQQETSFKGFQNYTAEHILAKGWHEHPVCKGRGWLPVSDMRVAAMEIANAGFRIVTRNHYQEADVLFSPCEWSAAITLHGLSYQGTGNTMQESIIDATHDAAPAMVEKGEWHDN